VSRRGPRFDDGGTGLVGTVGGALAVVGLLLVATQLLVHLAATSTLTGAAQEGARLAASGAVDHGDPAAVLAARQRAEAHVRALLGRYGDQVHLDWSGSSPDQVELRIAADPPSVVVRALPSSLGTDRIERVARARVERWR
jgi:hypothetical protein